MKVSTIITLSLIAIFFLLPIMAGNATIPKDISSDEVGDFMGGVLSYWFDVFKGVYNKLKGQNDLSSFIILFC